MVNQLSLDRKDFNNNHPYLGLRYLLDGIQEDQPCLIKNLFPFTDESQWILWENTDNISIYFNQNKKFSKHLDQVS